jgi:UDP-N-acetylmuramoyl-tripeptide--D-alanyl-D-alanine ligase
MIMIKELYDIYIRYQTICTDTRNIIPGSIFFALKGDNFNANIFADEAIDKGCAYAVIDEPQSEQSDKYIFVDNVLETLQQLAAFHRDQLNIPVIGITGTNGKTTSKELMHAVLSKKFKVLSTKGNFNNHIGVPLTILSIHDDTEIAVVEMGANHMGEIADLCKISKPDFGIITNIGKAHLEGFGSIEGIINTKKSLYDSVISSNGKLFVCSDNSLLMDISKGTERITYGVSPHSDCLGEISDSNPLLSLKWYCNKPTNTIEIKTNLVGYFNLENIMSAICVGEYFGVKADDIKDALESYVPSNNRSQVIKTDKNTILMDAYNANPSSMDASIKNFIQTKSENLPDRQAGKFAIIGDMLELGKDSLDEHRKIIELLKDSGIKKIIFIGKNFYSLKDNIDYPVFADISEASEWFKKNNIKNQTILIKGSRGISLEKLLEFL